MRRTSKGVKSARDLVGSSPLSNLCCVAARPLVGAAGGWGQGMKLPAPPHWANDSSEPARPADESGLVCEGCSHAYERRFHYAKRPIQEPQCQYSGQSLPSEGFKERAKYATIVCVHSGGGAKEQTIGVYAGRLAEAGYVTLAYDSSYRGASGGTPHFLDEPMNRVSDVWSAVDYVTTLSYVDVEKIGVLGTVPVAAWWQKPLRSIDASRQSLQQARSTWALRLVKDGTATAQKPRSWRHSKRSRRAVAQKLRRRDRVRSLRPQTR